MIKLLVVLLFFYSNLFAKDKQVFIEAFTEVDLPIGQGTQVKIIDYDPRIGGIFQGVSVKEPGEGFFYTRIEFIINSNPSLKKYLKKPHLLKGKTFTLKRDLGTFVPPKEG